jgi:hypothetical protein
MQNIAQNAADHFIQLYKDEMENVTTDSIFEWWTQTKDQYPGVEYNDVENIITGYSYDDGYMGDEE